MKRLKNNFLIAFLLVSLTGCYDSFDKDFEYSTVYFASQKPLRTVIADTDMKIKVGVAIGGMRKVNVNDWASFTIDPSLLVGTTFTLLPSNYYTLSSADKMTISNQNLAIADVEISFTDDFYNDPNAYQKFYALPFKITGHNLDSIAKGVGGVNKDYSIVAIKAVSKYQGSYYVRGTMVRLNTDGTSGTLKTDTTIYNTADLSRNIVRTVSSINRFAIQRPGFANSTPNATEAVNITVSADGNTVALSAGGTSLITDASAILESVDSQPEFTLNYTINRSGFGFKVIEKIIRRQDPLKDLRFEEW